MDKDYFCGLRDELGSLDLHGHSRYCLVCKRLISGWYCSVDSSHPVLGEADYEFDDFQGARILLDFLCGDWSG